MRLLRAGSVAPGFAGLSEPEVSILMTGVGVGVIVGIGAVSIAGADGVVATEGVT